MQSNSFSPFAAPAAEPTSRSARTLKRRLAGFAARCAMGSWVVLAAMPVAVVVVALS